MYPFCQRGTVLEQKKVKNSTLFPSGTKTVPFFQMGTVSEQKKGRKQYPFGKVYHLSTPRGTPFA